MVIKVIFMGLTPKQKILEPPLTGARLNDIYCHS